ncbi:DMT family transporter [Urechidicola sp. KH5]
MRYNQLKWIFLFTLSIIWGSSFILIKKGLIGLTPLQLGSLRVVFTALVLFIVGFKKLKSIKKENWKWIVLSGFIGTFFPAFLFAFAETEVDSGVTSILNSLTPLNAVIIGGIVFKIIATKRQVVGVLIGFLGTALLIVQGAQLNPEQNYLYAGFVVAATLMYAVNVNLIKKYLQHEKPLAIATGNFVAIIIPALLVLIATGFFKPSNFQETDFLNSLGFVFLLAVFGTALAKVLFNKLIQISSPIFASSVTYVMTIVAVLWGVLDGEKLGFMQVLGGCIILVGVYLANKKPTTK